MIFDSMGTAVGNLIKGGDEKSICGRFFPLSIILVGFASLIYREYGALPIRPDELWYVLNVEHPEKSLKLLFRFFHFYVAKLLTPFTESSLHAAAITSFLYASGVITVSYLLIQKVSNQTFAILGAVLVSTYPTLIYQSTWFGTDMSCLFFGSCAVYCAVRVYTDSRFYITNVILCGFFLVGTVYSKQAGICFIIPVALLLFPHLSLRTVVLFFVGIGGAFLFLSICDAIWLGDFFYHINPWSYVDFMTRFNGQLNEDMTNKATWKPTFLRQILDSTPWVIAYIVLTVYWLGSRMGRGDKRVYVAFCVFLVGVVSFSIHEAVHVRYVGLNIHFRYMLTMVVPLLVAFAILLPISEERVKSIRKLNLFLCMSYIVFLYVLHNPTYFKDLKSTWDLYLSLINVFSFWIFVLGLGFLFFKGEKKSSRVSTSINVLGAVLLIAYSTLWGNILGEYHEWRTISGQKVKFERLQAKYAHRQDVFLFADLKNTRIARNFIQYLYVSKTIDRQKYLDINTYAFSEILRPEETVNLVVDDGYQHVYTANKTKSLNAFAKKQGLIFIKRYSMFGSTLYRVKPVN